MFVPHEDRHQPLASELRSWQNGSRGSSNPEAVPGDWIRERPGLIRFLATKIQGGEAKNKSSFFRSFFSALEKERTPPGGLLKVGGAAATALCLLLFKDRERQKAKRQKSSRSRSFRVLRGRRFFLGWAGPRKNQRNPALPWFTRQVLTNLRIWSVRGGSTPWKAQCLPFRSVRDYVDLYISHYQSRLPLSVSF